MKIVDRVGHDNLRALAQPRYVDTSTDEFQEALSSFVSNNARNEKYRPKDRRRDLETIAEQSTRGLVAEFALKQVQGIEDNCPLVPDTSVLDRHELHIDQRFNGLRLQVKSRQNIGARYWSINEAQHKAIQNSMWDNDYFILVGVHKEDKNRWLAVPEYIIDARKIYYAMKPSQYKSWMYYYDTEDSYNAKYHFKLTNLLEQDKMEQIGECA